MSKNKTWHTQEKNLAHKVNSSFPKKKKGNNETSARPNAT